MRRLIVRIIAGFTVGLLVGGYLLMVRQGKPIPTAQASVQNWESGGNGKSTEYKNSTAAALAKKLTAGQYVDALDATRQSLALGGIAAWDGKANIVAAAPLLMSTFANRARSRCDRIRKVSAFNLTWLSGCLC